MDKKVLTVKTEVQAPADKVWDVWTKPGHITKWNQPSDDWHCPKAENDLRVGGKYNARMEAKDGSSGFDFEAIYDEVIDQKKITYTMSDGRKATTDFKSLGGATEVATTFDAENQNPIEMQQNGWQAILNNFKNYVESIS